MLSINGLHNFYYLPELHDMRCKAQRICEIIRGRYHRDPMNGDVYMFMSKDQRKVRMIHYERNAYYLHEKSFIKGYRFMRIERKDDVTVYKIDWKDLVTILETYDTLLHDYCSLYLDGLLKIQNYKEFLSETKSYNYKNCVFRTNAIKNKMIIWLLKYCPRLFYSCIRLHKKLS